MGEQRNGQRYLKSLLSERLIIWWKRKRKRKLPKEDDMVEFSWNSYVNVMFPWKSLTSTSVKLRFCSWISEGVLMVAEGEGGDFLAKM